MSGVGGRPSWSLGRNHTAEQWRRKMERRGWTCARVDEAILGGRQFEAKNHIDPANGATRYVHPETARSVVLDDATGEVIHVGGDGFGY